MTLLKKKRKVRKDSRVEVGADSASRSGGAVFGLGSAPTSERELLSVSNDDNSLYLVERDPYGKVSIVRQQAEFVSEMKRTDISPRRWRQLKESRMINGLREVGDWARITWKNQFIARKGCNLLHEDGLQTFEGHVSPARRYLVESGRQLARPRLGYVDLETDSRVPFLRKESARILAWSVVFPNGEKRMGSLKEDSNRDECRLIGKLYEQLERIDQVAAWGGDTFDFPVLKGRLIHNELDRLINRWKRWMWLDHVQLFRRMNSMAAESGEEKTSFKLDHIAKTLGVGAKHDFDASKTWEAWEVGGMARRKMLAYCVQDTDLMRKIEEKTGYIELLQTLAEACNVKADTRGANPSMQVEGFLLKLAHDRGYRFKTRTSFKRPGKDEQYLGAFVMAPREKGIVRDVYVADFKSLYPSIIVTWNMSPETIQSGSGSGAHSPLTDQYFATENEGVLPAALVSLMDLRSKWRDASKVAAPGSPEYKDAMRKSTAYKIAANSFYGVIGASVSPFFNKDIAESVTQCGVLLIQATIREAEEEWGMRVVYGDTDSLFIRGASKAKFERFIDHCNSEIYPTMLAQLGCEKNTIVLDSDKAFDRIVMVTAKRYAGRHKEGVAKSKPEIKGLEYMRGDTLKLARDMQAKVIDMLMGGGVIRDRVEECIETAEPFVPLIEETRNYILKGDLQLAEVMISKSLSRPIEQYARKRRKDGEWARQLPHVELARELRSRGADVSEGTKISYVCSDYPSHKFTSMADYKGIQDVDRYYVWEQCVFPATQRVLEAAFPEFNWIQFLKVRPKKPRVSKKKTTV